MTVVTPHPRPDARIVDRTATTRKVLAEPECRACGEPAATGHHVIPKSERGDDVLDNIAPVCGSGTTGCHGLTEARDRETRHQLIRAENVAYVYRKLGPVAGREYLIRNYDYDPEVTT